MTPAPFVLPPGSGLTTRPLVVADAGAVVALCRATERESLPEPMTELADVLGTWRQPSIDLARHSVAVLDEGRLVAYALLAGRGHAEGVVDPAHRDEGLGTALLAWLRGTAAAHEVPHVGQTVPIDSPAEAFLRAAGAHVTYEAWALELPVDRDVAHQPLPDGYEIGLARDEELTRVHRVVDDAFSAWPDREPVDYADWHAEFIEGDDAAAWQRQVVRDREGVVVGAAMATASEDGMVWVNQLAVQADQRGLGLGRALLAAAFTDGRRRGLHRAGLATDSRTGALPLYEHVGMEVVMTFRHLVIAV
ncbi:GNAT family N-acetyltransferase [Janibacter sp. GS2]|uniref:GNAT family N-acetyltransferase n=1 Tax=Janibacter sp. GS2 TaxID=3442646 RepID=UPI003EC097B7